METEHAWAAGFFDGEGYAGINRKSVNGVVYFGPVARIVQNRREPLDRFRAAVGVGCINGPYRRKGQPNEHWQYTISGRRGLTAAFSLIGPYLSSVKAAQIEAALCVETHARLMAER